MTSERAQFHHQRLLCLSVDRMNTDAVFPQQQPDVSLTWGSAHSNHTHFTHSRSPSHLCVRNASWENHLEEELWITSCSKTSSQRSRDSLIGYLQYVNHVTQQRLLVVSSTDKVIIQCHQFKLMSVSENTTTSTRIRTKKSKYQHYNNQYSTKSTSTCCTISTRPSNSNRTITKLSMPVLKIPVPVLQVQILKVSVAVLYSKYQH